MGHLLSGHVASLLFRTVYSGRRIRTWYLSAVLFPSSGSLVKTRLQGIESPSLASLLPSPFRQPLPGKTRVSMEVSQVWPYTRLAAAPWSWLRGVHASARSSSLRRLRKLEMLGYEVMVARARMWAISENRLGRRASGQGWRVHKDEQVWHGAWTRHHMLHEKWMKGS